MKPGDLVRFVEDESSAIMTVLQIAKEERFDEGWKFCTSGRKESLAVDVFHPKKGVRTYKSWALEVVSDNHGTLEHAKLTALAFAGSCSNSDGDCKDG